MNEADFFLSEGFEETSNLLLEYIVCSLPYKYGLMVSQENILLILWQYFYPSFFEDTKLSSGFFDRESGRLNENIIKEYITDTIRNARKKEHAIVYRADEIKFDTGTNFLFSFLEQFAAIKYR